MSVDTYLAANIKDVGLVRWSNTTSPILVHVAPFHWYEKDKQDNASVYEKMVWDGFNLWATAMQGQVRFKRVEQMNQSQINLVWRRVDRKSLGHCEYSWAPDGRLYSAEISIGLTDSKVHAYYDNPAEVKRTVIHEIGHALGLGHSNGIRDIMYPTHQIGINQVSSRDVETLKWLYKVPPGFKYHEEFGRLGLPSTSTIDDVIAKMFPEAGGPKTNFKTHLTPPKPKGLDLLQQQDLLTDKGRYLMATSQIDVTKITPLPLILPGLVAPPGPKSFRPALPPSADDTTEHPPGQ